MFMYVGGEPSFPPAGVNGCPILKSTKSMIEPDHFSAAIPELPSQFPNCTAQRQLVQVYIHTLAVQDFGSGD